MASIYKFRKTWYISYRDGLKRVRQSTGTTNKAIAEEKLHEIQAKEDRGELNLRVKAQNVAIETFVDEYLTTCQVNHAKRTFALEKIVLKLHFRRFCEAKKIQSLSQLSLHAVENYKIWRNDKAGPACINRELGILRALIARAVALGKLPSNPLKDLGGRNLLRNLPEAEKKVRYLSHEEIKRLMGTSDERWRPIICVAVNTGMRRSELQHMRWEDVDFARNQITVANHEDFQTKSRRVRHIPMTPACHSALEGLKRGEGPYVFGVKNGAGPFVNGFNREFTKIIRKAGIQGASFHTLRHSFASHLVMRGVPLSTVQEFLGHANLRTTQIYSHLAEDHKQAAIEKLEFAEIVA